MFVATWERDVVAASPFGEWLRKKRRATGLTQADLAESSGVSQSYIAKIETGVARDVSADVVRELSRGLGLDRKDTDEGLVCAGYAPIGNDLASGADAGSQTLYITDPDARIVAEAYQGLPDHLKKLVKGQVLSAKEIAEELDRKETVGGMRSDQHENPTRERDH